MTGTAGRQAIYYAKNIAAGSNTVTVAFNQAAAFVDVRILEYSGLDTTSPLDVTAGAAGSGASANSGAATTTSANELIFGAGYTVRRIRGGDGIHGPDHYHTGRGHRGRPDGNQRRAATVQRRRIGEAVERLDHADGNLQGETVSSGIACTRLDPTRRVCYDIE